MTQSPLWHPCTQMYFHQDNAPLKVMRGKGAYLYLENGQPVLDAISSWWVNLHGHSNPTINTAIKNQLENIEQVILAGFTHQPIEDLAHRLVELTPPELTRVFFADSGSAAVEVALKMSLQYWSQVEGSQIDGSPTGKPQRKTFISLENGYHGETLGSLAVTDIPLFSKQYQPLLIQHLRAPSPDLSQKQAEQTDLEFLQQQFAILETLVQDNHQHVCAIIVEPLVQGAAGMKMYPPIYLIWLRKLCDQYQIHLILDEIAVGFGRTGTLFAHEQAGIYPDFLCLSKGLTAGYLPMSCVMTTENIYQAFYSPDVSRGFLHSHSFTGNPLAASAALASLDIFEQQQTLINNQTLAASMQQQLLQLEDHPYISNIRQTGMIAAFDVVQNKGQPYVAEPQRIRAIAQQALKNGLLIRPIANHIYFIPPYCIDTDEIEHMFATTLQAVEDVMSSPLTAISSHHNASHHNHPLP